MRLLGFAGVSRRRLGRRLRPLCHRPGHLHNTTRLSTNIRLPFPTTKCQRTKVEACVVFVLCIATELSTGASADLSGVSFPFIAFPVIIQIPRPTNDTTVYKVSHSGPRLLTNATTNLTHRSMDRLSSTSSWSSSPLPSPSLLSFLSTTVCSSICERSAANWISLTP